ncbi:Thiamine-monophosphate kinase [Acidisarcina polymorpha]|uniref:Thiamine-monophosphate kinase n=1 Tax=Acidisarcina polymorpha TaxID=2211140 RepID=A0A2Z5FVN8_9BACT|nr:Thiamine-monophosphate kinase [Acidisarcina polymorpha]
MIAALRARNPIKPGKLRLGIGDDCAILRPNAGDELAITTDFSLENVHFRRDWHSPEAIGHRCLARGLSDLAAVGAKPMAAFLSLALPKELTARHRGKPAWVERFFDGLLALAAKMNVPLAGGDTAESPAHKGKAGLVAADIVLVGGVKRGRALLRSGAKPGDLLYVTGPGLGGAGAELLALERNPSRFTALKVAAPGHPHLYPEPRIAAGLRLRKRGLATAAIDLSDGLSTDLHHLCGESGLAAEIDATVVPIHPMAQLAEAAGWARSALQLALHGGEDYELLFTARPQTKIPRELDGVAIHAIGRMSKMRNGKPAVTLLEEGKAVSELRARGWEHFRGSSSD